MKYPCNILFRQNVFHKYNMVFGRTMFIRYIDRPNSELSKKPNNLCLQQSYNKFLVLDFEATCNNKLHQLKPQVGTFVKYIHLEKIYNYYINVFLPKQIQDLHLH